MSDAAPVRPAIGPFSDRFARLSTGIKMLLLLSLALLPLGLIALIASMQTTRTADLQRRATLRVALSESVRRFGAETAVDVTTLKSSVNLLERGGNESEICARTLSVLATAYGEPTRFAIYTRGGRESCATPDFDAPQVDLQHARRVVPLVGPRGLEIVVPSDTGAFIGVAWYPRDLLDRIVRPAGFNVPYSIHLRQGGRDLPLIENYSPTPLERSESVSGNVAGLPLTLSFSIRSAPFTVPELITMLLPLIMWAAALLVVWVVVNRLVLQPLGRLRATVATYHPGEIMQPLQRMRTPAREIRELGDTFRAISETVAAHESELALGLERQRRLTREVHHRVKNNLQVVASLINLHARAAKASEAVEAYASIGRRVDALAVVHRNHYAELEENRGLSLRSLVGELAANLRATAPGEASKLAILIDVPSLYVGQDTAIPLAFIITELVELAMSIDPAASIRIEVTPHDDPGRGCLTVCADALRTSPALTARLDERYGRVLDGLARQLRSTLQRDEEEGCFTVCFAILAIDPAAEKKFEKK